MPVPDILHKSLLAPQRPIPAADLRATILLQKALKVSHIMISWPGNLLYSRAKAF